MFEDVFAMQFVAILQRIVKYLHFSGSFATIHTGFNATQHTGNQTAAIQNNVHSFHILHAKGLCCASTPFFLVDYCVYTIEWNLLDQCMECMMEVYISDQRVHP